MLASVTASLKHLPTRGIRKFRRHEWFNLICVYMGNPDQTRHLKCSSGKKKCVGSQKKNVMDLHHGAIGNPNPEGELILRL